MAMIEINISSLPSDVALWLAQSQDEHIDAIANSVAVALDLDEPERQIINDELVGKIAKLIDSYMKS